MKKKTDEELGILLTREIRSMMFNEKLTAEQRVSIFCSIVSGEDVGDPLLSAFAESLKTGFIHANEARKASIYSKRERERERLRNHRQSSAIIGNHRQSTAIIGNHRQSTATAIYGNGNGNGKGNIPLPPKGGKGENVPTAISPEELMREAEPIDDQIWAKEFVNIIVGWYPYEVNQDGLKKIIIAKCKKKFRRAMEDGLTAWINSGAWDEKRFVPPDIVKWIKLERFLDQPPDKKISAARAADHEGLNAPSCDATMRMLSSEGEE